MSPPNKRCRRRRPADRSPTGLPAYAGVRLGAGVLTLLPVRLSLWLARIAGRLAYHLDGRHHAIATENLRHAYGDSLTPEERERIILGAFVNLTQSVVEFHHATRLARKGRALEVVELGTTAETFKAKNKEMGVVFVSCHLGNWEHWRTRPPEEKEAARLPRHTNPPTEGRREAL